ncbi:hypothetical protein KIH31_07635 [Paenarthrobacter sp. DKR-5]|uniref:hypothetical protein n=1 Tax=Paenarthrobacter sp. DKR-5 TaxID=2835535 RepID=UPI001BDCD562|nr:hypothetical protein [Paenarthrobacter sp. DKR-5]MBT1002472.1 hypothetical protein [Paenarthrobacter sp. DKR-5]
MNNPTPYLGVPDPAPAPRSSSRPGFFTASLRRWWPLLLVGLLGGGLAGSGVAGGITDTHSASALILLNPLDGNPFYPSTRGEQLVNLASESQVLRSNDVAKAVIAAAAPGASQNDLLNAVTVTNPTNTQLLQVHYTDPSTDVAVKRAQAFADAYLTYRRNRAAASVANQVKGIQAEVTKYDQELTALTAQLVKARPGTAQAGMLNVQVQSVGSRISQLNAQISNISSTSLDAGHVVTPAQADKDSLVGPKQIILAAGLTLGLLLAAGLIFLLSGTRARVRSGRELQAMGLPAWAVLRRQPDPSDLRLPVESSLDEAALALRGQLLAALRRRAGHTVLLVPASRAAAAPATAVPLARSLAAANIRTILVDTTGTLRTPDGTSAPGFADLLQGRAGLAEILEPVAPGLQVVAAGASLRQAPGMLDSPRTAALLEELSGRCDVLLIASRPVQSPGVRSLAAASGAAMLEVVRGGTRRREAQDSLRAFQEASAEVLGAVIVKVNRWAGWPTAKPARAVRTAGKPAAAATVKEPAKASTALSGSERA